MPPKPKLHKNTSKSVSKPPQILHPNNRNEPTTNSVASTPSTSVLSLEQEQQFELELCWCIQQLQNALKSEKLNSKQIQDHTKSLNSLMSNSAPIVKKRQVMRLCFGDYRTKMAEEAKKASKKLSIRVTPASPSTKSLFIKKAIVTSSENNFKFNFPMDTSDDTEVANNENDTSDVKKCVNNVINSSNGPFIVKSDNSFRFNFRQDEADNKE